MRDILFRDLLESVQEGAGIMKQQSAADFMNERARELSDAVKAWGLIIANDPQFSALLNTLNEWSENMAKIELEDLLMNDILTAGLPTPKRQYKFHSSRRWLADFAWPESLLIVEVNGMTHVASRGHTSFSGIHRDYEKNNCAQLMGYVYLQFDKEMVEDGTAIRAICDYLGRCEG